MFPRQALRQKHTDSMGVTNHSRPEADTPLTSVAQHDFRLRPNTPASDAYAAFQRDPLLPGVIVDHGEKVAGRISRQRFFQLLGHRHSCGLRQAWACQRCQKFQQRAY
jgi:hypothetical protein